MQRRVVINASDLHAFGSDIAPLDAEAVADNGDLLKAKGQEASPIKGTIAELAIAAHLLRHGYEPYFPLPGRTAKSDLLSVST